MWRVGTSTILSLEQYHTLNIDTGFVPDVVIKFWRLELHNSLFYSKEYARTTKTNNYTVLYDSDGVEGFGVIKFFLELSCRDVSRPQVLAIIDKLITAPYVCGDVLVPHLRVVVAQHQSFVSASCLKMKCILIDVDDTVVACPFDSVCTLST